MNIEEIDRLHDSGLMPDSYWVLQNGRSAQYNYEYSKRMLKDRIMRKREIEDIKKKMEQQIYDAIFITLQESESNITEAAADDIIASINTAFGGVAPAPSKSKKSFVEDLGAMLGKALGEAPFKLLDEIFDDDYKRRK